MQFFYPSLQFEREHVCVYVMVNQDFQAMTCSIEDFYSDEEHTEQSAVSLYFSVFSLCPEGIL